MALHIQQASPAGQGMRKLAGALTPPEQSPSEALQDMRLPPRAIEYLRAPLSALGMEVREGIIQVRRGAERVHSVIGDGEQRRIVLHIAHWILDNPTDAKDAALASLAWAFEEGTELFIVSEGLDIIPARAYRRMILEECYPKLAEVYRTKRTKSDQELRDLLHMLAAIEYEQGAYYDVHPAIVPILKEKNLTKDERDLEKESPTT